MQLWIVSKGVAIAEAINDGLKSRAQLRKSLIP